MKIVKIDGDKVTVSSGGLRREANISLLKGAKVGDYVLIHAGFAIERIKPVEARKTLKLLKEL